MEDITLIAGCFATKETHRTIGGISRQTGLSEADVALCILENAYMFNIVSRFGTPTVISMK